MCDKIKTWLSHVAKTHQFEYKICGKSGKDEGYMGDITFVTITSPKTLDLVIKSSKNSPILRHQTPMKLTFEKEIFIYEQVLPTFRDLEAKTGENLLDFMPFCHFTQIEDSGEVLILENLKNQGFEVCDRTKVLGFGHVRLVLEAYGKWHAFSYALRTRKRPIFDQLTRNNINMFCHFILAVDLVGVMWEDYTEAKNACFGHKSELDLSKQDATSIFTQLFAEEQDFQVIVHGDCWNNNFMFREENNKPVSVRILDWQCSGLASPVMDLSHFIYGCCDTETHPNVGEFLRIYYRSLGSCLRSLGCDVEEVFPYGKLVEHWGKFARYGLFLQPWVVKYSICESSEAPDFVEAAEGGKEFLDNFNIAISDKEEFYRRVKNNFLHYLRNL